MANSSNGSQMKKNDQLNVKSKHLLIILLNNPIKKLMENKKIEIVWDSVVEDVLGDSEPKNVKGIKQSKKM